MSNVCFIPIKANSERIPGKNFQLLNGKKLYEYMIEHCLESNAFDEIYIDSNSDEIREYVEKKGLKYILRKEELASNAANGNDLLVYHRSLFPEYDNYFQLFVTAPYLQPSTIKICVDILSNSNEYDSCFTAIKYNGFFWLNRIPVNYRPCILPRSQDLEPVFEETTGLYGMKGEALDKFRCRIGANPYIHIVEKFEAVDINTPNDFRIAEYIGKHHWGY